MYHYLLPLIIAFPRGYDVCVTFPLNQIIDRMADKENDEEILINCKLINDGQILINKEKTILVNNKIDKGKTESFFFNKINDLTNSSYLEFDIISKKKKLIFKNNIGLSFYSIYSFQNKKIFFSDNAFKTGSPNVIYQISKIKRFVDTYSAINIDLKRSLGETMFFINPYKKKVICKIKDDELNNITIVIPPESVREQKLDVFAKLKNIEHWMGHIQIYASNRLITFNYKHQLENKELISDFEHLDPYRLEDTTVSLSELARIKVGNFIKSVKIL